MKIALAVVCLLCSLTACSQEQGRSALDDFIRSAEQGNTEAQFSLATMYYRGQGVPQDYGQAAKWVQLAAEQGHAAAQSSLGNMYSRLPGLPNRASSKPLKHPNCSGNSQPASGAA